MINDVILNLNSSYLLSTDKIKTMLYFQLKPYDNAFWVSVEHNEDNSININSLCEALENLSKHIKEHYNTKE